MRVFFLYNPTQYPDIAEDDDINEAAAATVLINALREPKPTWWCHQMETFSALLALCAGNSPARWIPRTKASDTELWCFLWSAPE